MPCQTLKSHDEPQNGDEETTDLAKLCSSHFWVFKVQASLSMEIFLSKAKLLRCIGPFWIAYMRSLWANSSSSRIWSLTCQSSFFRWVTITRTKLKSHDGGESLLGGVLRRCGTGTKQASCLSLKRSGLGIGLGLGSRASTTGIKFPTVLRSR